MRAVAARGIALLCIGCLEAPDGVERSYAVRAAQPSAAGAGATASAPGAAGSPSRSEVLVGAGDIADCRSRGDEATAALLDRINGTVFTVGDNAYGEEEDGSLSLFTTCYAPSWGRHKARTRPAAGNHDYGERGAPGYFQYFGASAGRPGEGWYSYDLGAWHVVVLNTNCRAVGGCEEGSPQERWLRADLAAHPRRCTLAYWHHPRFSSVGGKPNRRIEAFWQALYDAGVDVVIAGHDHLYERFAPQTPAGAVDPARGIRQFIVGTGGKSHEKVKSAAPNSEVINNDTFGVLKLTLRPDGYDWQFVPVAGATFTDSGSASCH